ncbi:MAG: hypothetical protein K8R59_03805 [Thermoanaerobaculales bacterium]|nr:hypothetical protein [Thermoanaerobaculales bacterium]
MKISELTEEKKHFIFARINEHDKKLSSANHSAIEAGVNYLFLTNAGGAVAAFSFLGSQSSGQKHWGPLIAVGIFVFGVALVGLVKGYRVSYFGRVAHDWSANAFRFFEDKTSWEELNNRHAEARQEPRWPYCFAYFSFLCFVVGSMTGFCLLLVAQ